MGLDSGIKDFRPRNRPLQALGAVGILPSDGAGGQTRRADEMTEAMKQSDLRVAQRDAGQYAAYAEEARASAMESTGRGFTAWIMRAEYYEGWSSFWAGRAAKLAA